MTLFHRLGLIALLCVAAAFSGFFYGRHYEYAATLKAAVIATQTRETIENELSNLTPLGRCLATGWLSKSECTSLMQRLEKSTKTQ